MSALTPAPRFLVLLAPLLGIAACASPGAATEQEAGTGAQEQDAASTSPPTSDEPDARSEPAHDATTLVQEASASSDDASVEMRDGGDADALANPNAVRLVGYLPNYNGSYADWAGKVDFSKMTHLNLAFAYPPPCAASPCTAKDDMTFSTGDDGNIAAVVNAAHAAGVKVLLSVGGGGTTKPIAGDQAIIQFYNAGLSAPLVESLASFVSANNVDGVDLDIESPSVMGAPYATFVSALVSRFRPEGKLITAAMAQWIQSGIPAAALHQFDFINIMTYSNLSDSQNDLTYYVGLNVPKDQIVLGVKFFGDVQDQYDDEPEYSDILAAYPNAWQSDSVSGGSIYSGDQILYTGEATMAKEVQLGKQYGGIMIWELTGDAPAPHSLMKVVDDNF